MKIKRRSIKKPRVEMIPLIDSVFLVLVFFIYAFLSMTVHRGLPVFLPKATAAEIDKQDYVSITVTHDDLVFLNKKLVTYDELRASLNSQVAANQDLRVYINGDQRAHHGSVVRVLDVVQSVGISKLSIETEGVYE